MDPNNMIFNITEEDTNFFHSYQFMDKSKQANIIATFTLIIIGLIGNSLIIYVFAQKRFRNNSSNIFLLCLAINDNIFLIIHFIEDTVKSYSYNYLTNESNKFLTFLVSFLNLTDRFDLACRGFNYLRYVLRFISAYIIVAFTIQRLLIVSSPLNNRFKSKRFAWQTVLIIIFVSLLINLWVPFIFMIKNDNDYDFCDTNQFWAYEYMIFTIIYVVLIMMIPIVLVFISNSYLLYKTNISETLRENFKNKTIITKSVENGVMNRRTLRILRRSTNNEYKLKPYYLNINQIVKNISNQTNNSNKLTKKLTMFSFSFAILNIPYFISW